MAADFDISTPEELRAFIEGKSNQEIEAAIRELGVDDALDRIFKGMEEAFLPAKAAGQRALVQWDVGTPAGERSYHVIFAGDTCSTARGPADKPRVTLRASIADFLRVITGKISGPTAFFQGKLKISGDVLFAQTQQNWFRIPPA